MRSLTRRCLLRRFSSSNAQPPEVTEAISKEVGPIKNYGSESIFSNPLDMYTRSKVFSQGIKKIAVSSYAMLSKEAQDLSGDALYFSVMVGHSNPEQTQSHGLQY